MKVNYNEIPILDEIAELLEISRRETENIGTRDIKCPRCSFTVSKVYNDVSGHMKIKCPKCKLISTINLKYFCRKRKVGILRIKNRIS